MATDNVIILIPERNQKDDDGVHLLMEKVDSSSDLIISLSRLNETLEKINNNNSEG